MLIFGLIMAPFGTFMEEIWHLKDYWDPPYLIHFPYFILEDTIFSFLITGISVGIYDFLFVKNYEVLDNKKVIHKYAALSLLVFEILILLVFTNYLGYNSIIVCSFSFMFFAILMILFRRDLFLPSILSGIFVLLIILPTYAFLVNYLSPNYVDDYFFLSNTNLGKTILGNIPLTEIFWYFSWGCCCSVLYDFQRNHKKIYKK